MMETQDSEIVSTRLERIAELARQKPGVALLTLAHHIDMAWLLEAYRRTRKGGAPGVDGQSAAEYAARLEDNLRSLLDRAKSGAYRAPPVRRAYIPKGGGEMRPLGIPTFEDKVLQRAVAMVLEAVYEQDFLPCSYGFRPGCSAHQALEVLRERAMEMDGGYILEVDIRKFFDSVDKGKLQEVLRQRVRDGVLVRLVGKWLNAGVLEEGQLHRPETGTPQGGVISPLLANIYLHEVVDVWFEREVRPRMKGRAHLVRYADDIAMLFENEEDARRVFAVLPKRFGRYGLTLHPEKTRLVPFKRPSLYSKGKGGGHGTGKPGTFDFLGFTLHWGRSLRNRWVVKRRTACDRFARTVVAIRAYCKANLHAPLAVQSRELSLKLRGHYGYFAVPTNAAALWRVYDLTIRIWRRVLGRRSQTGRVKWERMRRLLRRYPLPQPGGLLPRVAKP